MHGLGHGTAMIAAKLETLKTVQEKSINSTSLSASHDLIPSPFCGSLPLQEPTQNAEPVAVGLCGGGLLVDERYVCAGGAYMTLFAAEHGLFLPNNAKESQDQDDYVEAGETMDWHAAVCESSLFPAPCYHFYYQGLRGGNGDVHGELMPENFKKDFCTDKFGKQFQNHKQRRGCIYGHASSVYQEFDTWKTTTNRLEGHVADYKVNLASSTTTPYCSVCFFS